MQERQTSASEFLFRDRKDAGRQLAARLSALRPINPLVLALPRGGVPVGVEVAEALDAPLDLILARKIVTSWQPEFAIGAVMDGARRRTFINKGIAKSAGVSDADLARIAKIQYEELERRRQLWLGRKHRIPVTGHTVIVVDDGIATGATMRVALEAVRSEDPIRLLLASPVAPEATADMLRGLCDDAVFLATPRYFTTVGEFYRDFHQLHDNEVNRLLHSARKT